MNILDVALAGRIAASGGGGGGSGTDNYNDLSNLPQINGETLAGNKTAENLGLQDALTFDSAPTEDSTNPVESGGVYYALAGKQDNLTFDDAPTENSTNPVKSGGVYSALDDKQDNLTFDGVYNASTNKAATESTVTNAIAGLDVSALSVDADETISSISETDGKVSVTKQNIAIASNQVVAMTGYTKPSSAPATPAIQQGDTANAAIGKLEYKADVNQTNILSVEDMVCATEFSSSTAYAVGDMVTYEHKLYKFINAHQGAWSASDVQNTDLTRMMTPFFTVPINHNMIYRGQNLGDTLTDAQHTALSSGNFTDLYLGDYWTKTVTIPAGTYTGGDGESVEVPAQTNITLKAVIADFDTFYAGYASSYAGINTHHAAVIVTGFSNVVWNKTNSTAGGYVASLIHKWLVGSALPQIEAWFGSAKVLSHQKLLTNAITGDAASGWAWSSQKISLLSENQMYGYKVWGNSKASNGGYEPGEAFKHLNVFNHINASLLFGNKNIWLRDIASAVWAANLSIRGDANYDVASATWIVPAALILLS